MSDAKKNSPVATVRLPPATTDRALLFRLKDGTMRIKIGAEVANLTPSEWSRMISDPIKIGQ